MKTFFCILTLIYSVVDVHSQNSTIAKGNEYYKEGRYELAEGMYRKVRNNAVASFNLANSLIRQKKNQEALQALAAVENEKDLKLRAAAHYNAGVIFSHEKSFLNAIDAYKACLRITPEDKHARENLQKAMLELKAEQKQKTQSSDVKISTSQADQKLQALQEKERNLQKKLSTGKKGQSMENDW